MAVSAKWYANGLKAVLNGDVDWTADTIKVTLHTASYTPAQSTDDFFDDATNELSTGAGYTAGGATLGTKSVALSSLTVALKAAASSWTASGTLGPARFAVVRKVVGTDATDILLGYVDFGENVQATNDDFVITWDSTDGVLKSTAA